MKRPLTAQEQTLRTQSRRRMIGAFVLMLAVVLFLPMMLDHAASPKQAPSVPQAGPVAADRPATPAPPLPEAAPVPGPEAPAVVAPQAVAPVAVPAAVPTSTVPAPAAETPVTAPVRPAQEESAGHGGRFLVQVGVFSDRRKAVALAHRLEQEKLTVHSEDVRYKEGVRVRVRVGPFQGRKDAAEVAQRLDRMGIKSMVVAP